MIQKEKEYLSIFENKVQQAVYELLRNGKKIDERMPDMPDIDGKWEEIGAAYLTDGVREFNGYPLVSLGWMMYVGMAVAHLWDKDWEKHSRNENLYTDLRDKRGYDCMDEYIREDVLHLNAKTYKATEELCGRCAQTVYDIIMHEHLEPGTTLAFHAYVRALKVLYRLGAATELYRLGYKMTQVS